MTTTTVRPGARVRTRAPRAISYNRISKFRVARAGVEALVSRGVDRQESDAETTATDLDLGPVLHFTDNGESASGYATKERTDWPVFLAAVRSGEYTHALLWNVDRAARTTEAFDEFLAACRAGGVLIVQTATGQVADPDNIHDVHSLKQAALQAEYEVAKMSMRQRRAKAEAVKMGKPHGGRRRFGYEPGMTEVREAEAAIVRDLVTRFLAGESLYALAKGLTDAGVPTANGGKWTGPNLRGLLRGPHLAGLRVHAGQVTGKGTWPAIIPVETHDHVVALLNNPSRRPTGSGNARRWLLSGLMVCATCGAPCRARPETTTKRDHTVPASYFCSTGRHVHRRADLVERKVELAIVERLTAHDMTGLFLDDTHAAEVIRLREAREALDDRMREYVDAVATMAPAAFAAATNRLQADMDALDVQLLEAATEVRQASRVLEGATGELAALAWFGPGGPDGDRVGGWSLARRRSIIAELAEVRLVGGRHGTTATGTRFDPEDVVLDWR